MEKMFLFEFIAYWKHQISGSLLPPILTLLFLFSLFSFFLLFWLYNWNQYSAWKATSLPLWEPNVIKCAMLPPGCVCAHVHACKGRKRVWGWEERWQTFEARDVISNIPAPEFPTLHFPAPHQLTLFPHKADDVWFWYDCSLFAISLIPMF